MHVRPLVRPWGKRRRCRWPPRPSSPLRSRRRDLHGCGRWHGARRGRRPWRLGWPPGRRQRGALMLRRRLHRRWRRRQRRQEVRGCSDAGSEAALYGTSGCPWHGPHGGDRWHSHCPHARRRRERKPSGSRPSARAAWSGSARQLIHGARHRCPRACHAGSPQPLACSRGGSRCSKLQQRRQRLGRQGWSGGRRRGARRGFRWGGGGAGPCGATAAAPAAQWVPGEGGLARRVWACGVSWAGADAPWPSGRRARQSPSCPGTRSGSGESGAARPTDRSSTRPRVGKGLPAAAALREEGLRGHRCHPTDGAVKRGGPSKLPPACRKRRRCCRWLLSALPLLWPCSACTGRARCPAPRPGGKTRCR